MSLTKQACSFVHVGLQSNGYHTSTTFFLPAKSESFTSFLSWFCNAKSGAVCPTPIAMFFLRSVWIRCHHHIESCPASPAAQRLRAAEHRTLWVYTSFRKSAGRRCHVLRSNSPRTDDDAARIGRSLSFRCGQLWDSRGSFVVYAFHCGDRTAFLRLRRGLSHLPFLPFLAGRRHAFFEELFAVGEIVFPVFGIHTQKFFNGFR